MAARTNRCRATLIALVTACATGACGSGEADDLELERADQALLGHKPAVGDSTFYFRCSATSWKFGGESRLVADPASGLLSLTYEVDRARVIERGDHCLLSETRGWLRREYSTRDGLQVPGQVTLTRGRFSWPFHVTYPGAGAYRVTFDRSTLALALAPLAPAKTVFSGDERLGDINNYAPRTPVRWSIATDAGDDRYFLNSSSYAAASGGRLGEYSIFSPETYVDFVVKASVRANEELAVNPSADFAVVYGYVDDDNYSFMAYSAQTAETELVQVQAGQRQRIASGTRPGIADSGYHEVQLWRHGPSIRAMVNGQQILSANEPSSMQGKVGIGSLDDSAYFDDIAVSTYYDVTTEHYRISLPTDQSAYQDAVTSVLENTYAVYFENTGWDINQRLGHAYYDYRYRPPGWRWFDDANGCCELGGGLTVSGGPSVVNSDLIPQSRLPAADGFNILVAISLHELGNGWFLPGITSPEWVEWLRSESHSGFLRAEGELDLGYCADANREHAGHYADYLARSLDDRRLRGDSVEPLLISLRERYGWGVFKALYDAAQAGELDYLANLPSSDRDNDMVLFLSRQVNEDLSGFFERELGIVIREDVRTALQGMPPSDLSVLATLPCHPPKIHATPSPVTVATSVMIPAPITKKVYVQAPADWSVRTATPADWLEIERDGTSQATTLTLTFHPPAIRPGVSLTTDLVFESPAVEAPLSVPVSFRIF